MKIRRSISLAIAGVVLGLWGCTEDSDPVGLLLSHSTLKNEVTTNTLKVQTAFNTRVQTLDVESASTITDPQTGTQTFCVWRAVAYRLSQICAQVWDDGVFRSYQVAQIETGWTADEGVSLFTEALGIPADRVVIPADAEVPRHLSLGDSWYEITFTNGRALFFQATAQLYHAPFLTYREHYLNGEGGVTLPMVERERAIVIQTVRTLPFRDNFEITDY